MKTVISTSAAKKVAKPRAATPSAAMKSRIDAKIAVKKAQKKKRMPWEIPVGGVRAVVPAENKEKIQKLQAKKKELIAKHKVALATIEKSLKALGFKPAVPGRRPMIK